jgi:hypothetical protein
LGERGGTVSGSGPVVPSAREERRIRVHTLKCYSIGVARYCALMVPSPYAQPDTPDSVSQVEQISVTLISILDDTSNHSSTSV